MNGDLDAYQDPMAMLHDATTYLARVSHVLAESDRFDDITQIRDTGELYRQYARQRAYGIDIQNIGAEIKLRAERRAGELLRKMLKNPGQLFRGTSLEPREDALTYDDLGVPKTTATRWQQESLLPEDLFEQYIAETKARHDELTSTDVLALVKGLHQDTEQSTIHVSPLGKEQPRERRSRPQRWAEALETLRALQEEYQEWLEHLPESLQSTPLAEKLEAVCEIDLDQLDIDLPRGYGRD